MPMLTAASDAYDRRSCEFHELSHDLQQLAEAAAALRGAWELLETLETTARREGRHDTAHDVRSPEQSAYLAWQGAELVYQQVMSRARVRVDEHQGAVVVPWDAKSERDRAEALAETEFWAGVEAGRQFPR